MRAGVTEDFDEAGITYNRHWPMGMIVEAPAAVKELGRFVEEIDFISIGTDDLIQYAIAVESEQRFRSLVCSTRPARRRCDLSR